MQQPKNNLDNHNNIHKVKWRMLWQHPAYALGLGLGSGLASRAPGTVGTLLGWVLFLLFEWLLPARIWCVLVCLSVPLGWWVCTQTASALRVHDPSCIVWDEIAAFWLLLWTVNHTLTPSAMPLWTWHILAFIVFRFFDAVKPQPVRWADHIFQGGGMRGGWGIMFDDLVAAGCSYLLLAVIWWGELVF